MTAVIIGNTSTAPSDANELSKLTIWTAENIRTIQPKKQYVLGINQRPESIVDLRIFPTRDYGTRLAIFGLLELNSDWKSTTGKLWEKIKPIPIDSSSPQGATDTFAPGTGGNTPATVSNFARLMCWCAEALNRCNPQTYAIEDERIGPILLADIRTGETPEHGWLLSYRLSIPMNPAYASQAQKLYQSAYAANHVSLPNDLLT